MIIEPLLLTVAIVYLVKIIILTIGLRKATNVKQNADYEPLVSVIVAARNEEEFISDCITSLTQLDYPREKLEIILVNDRSTDKTLEIIQSFEKEFKNIKSITTDKESGNLKGKANAVAQGIEISQGDVLMFTDADCIVPKSWVRETVKYFNQDISLVGGFTKLEANNIFEKIQNLDWLFLFNIASGAIGLNVPLTVVGNNLSVRRSAYEETGGFKKIPFSVTEDFALVQAINKIKPKSIRFPLNKQTTILSKPCKTIKHLFHQRQRWSVGGLDMVLPGKLIAFISWLYSFLLIVGIFTIPTLLWGTLFFTKTLIDYNFLQIPTKKLNQRINMIELLLFEIYLNIYVLIIPFVAILSKNIIWKERTL